MNIFDHNTPNIGEDFTTLFESKNIKIVRIVSSDNLEQKVYIQNEDEFVVLLEGEAKIKMDNKIKLLKKGEYLHIPAGTLHEVLETTNGTLWLSIYFK